MFVVLDGGLSLPLPTSVGTDPFHREKGITDRRWKSGKVERWLHAYTHCLYSLHSQFDEPIHKAVGHIGSDMLGVEDGFVVALRFIGEMQLHGFITLHKRKQKGKKKRGKMDYEERIIIPTKKLLNMNIDFKNAPESSIVLPAVIGEDYLSKSIVIRHGVSSKENKKVGTVINSIAEERFTVNEYIHDLVKAFPPDKLTDKEFKTQYMLTRTLATADMLRGKTFRFGYFFDSRSRMYDNTTCGVSPQGSDYEKALLIPTYAEPLTPRGVTELLEAAWGYSEIRWDMIQMIRHARSPEEFQYEWKLADKPYSYMACANLLAMYDNDPKSPLPAFRPYDGRCSGLQHWSALCRSRAITAHLGMEKLEHERDIYEQIAWNWEDTLPQSQKYLATRKAAKIPTMTWGYNATRMTSMEWLDKLYGEKRSWHHESESYQVSQEGLDRASAGRLGCDLYDQLNTTLSDLTVAVKWVSDCASIISKEGNPDIHWPTPDGFECKQRKVVGVPVTVQVRLSDGSRFTVGILDYSEELPAHGKHRSAIAPNIIHSLDATHLRMVARILAALGLPMIFIHDSFATHVNHTETLYETIVDTFAELYSGNWLLELCNYWTERYDVILQDPPKLGDWEPETVKFLDKFFM
jgi:hypothetical protein